jgi:tungstate transport system permease protein
MRAMGALAESVGIAWQWLWSGDARLWQIVGRSLAVSASACALACLIGLPLGAWLGVARFRGRAVVVMGVNTLMAVPSVVVGLVVYLLLSRSGPLGFLGWLFSFPAMVLAQTLLVLPLVVGLARQVVQEVEQRHGEQLRALGAGVGARAVWLAWDERVALLMVVIAAFARAVAEVGAVMIVGGNIEGHTRVMTTAIALETSKGDLPLALGLGLVLLVVVLGLHALVALLRQASHRWAGPSAAWERLT